MTDVFLGLVDSLIFFNMFSSLMIDLAELEKEQKVDEVKLFTYHSNIFSLTHRGWGGFELEQS